MENQHNPWTTLNTKPIYDNAWITVTEDQVIQPKGNRGIYGKVHFKNRAVGILPIDHDQNIWLVGQYRYTLNAYSWEIPEGGAPNHESLLSCAQRELREETGLMANSWKMISQLHTSNSVTDEIGYIYLAEDLLEGEPDFEDTELLEIRKLPFAQAIDMVMKQEITDSLSMVGILKLARIKGW
ncbi:MAG: NUDIX domain-containing protein [Cyclobacteriaceae bacterium]